METVLRLAWALPLVLAIGLVTLLILKRFVVRGAPVMRQTQRMRLDASLPLSDDTCVHLIEADGKPYLILESTRQAALHPMAPQSGAAPGASIRVAPDWIQRLYKARAV